MTCTFHGQMKLVR